MAYVLQSLTPKPWMKSKRLGQPGSWGAGALKTTLRKPAGQLTDPLPLRRGSWGYWERPATGRAGAAGGAAAANARKAPKERIVENIGEGVVPVQRTRKE